MREGPQPPACALQECDAPPANGMVGYCIRHQGLYTATAPVVEPDDPKLLEREAKKAAAAEEKEYLERRRVRTWRTLENGTRVPDEYWSDEELEAIEAEAERAVTVLGGIEGRRVAVPSDMLEHRFASRVTTPSHTWDFDSRTGERIDPEKQALRLLKRALRGKLGPGPEKMARALVDFLESL